MGEIENVIISLIMAPFILFMIFVAPIWVVLHYRGKRKLEEGMSEDDALRVRELVDQAEKMRDRIRNLENLLDAEHGDWRKSQHR